MKRLLREPLLHFLVLGAALFAIYHYRQRGSSEFEPSRQIVLSSNDLRQLASNFNSQENRPPTPAELDKLVENKVQEEVLYREALALGLDKDDAVVKSRLADKMLFLSDDAIPREPTTAELKAWYDKHSDQFITPSRVSFRHLFFSSERRGQNAQSDATQALTKIAAEPKDSKLVSSLTDPFKFQDDYSNWKLTELATDFGSQFAQSLSKLKAGAWQGPVESSHGWHIVFIDTFVPDSTPAFDEIKTEVSNAWMNDQKAQSRQATYNAMRAKYSIQVPSSTTPKQ